MIEVGPAALLQAQSAYNTIQKTAATPQNIVVEEAVSFQKMVNKSFNKFAEMNAQQILAQVKQVSSTGPLNAQSSITGSIIGTVANAVQKDEDVKKRSLLGKASLSEVIAATSEAKQVLQTVVVVRNKVFEAFNQIMNMPI